MPTAAKTPPTRFVPGDERARAAGIKSGEIRRARREAQAAQEAEAEALKERFLDLDLHAEEVGESAMSCAALIIQRIALDQIPVRNGAEAAALVAKLYEVARLESGQVTSLTGRVSLQLNDEEVRARIESARASLDPVALSSDTVTPQVTGPASSHHEGEAPAPAVIDVED